MKTQLTLAKEKIEKLCPTCNRGLIKDNIYSKEFTLNNVPVEIKQYHCSNCNKKYTYLKCVLCGKEFQEKYPKSRVDCFYPYCCPKCREKENIEEEIKNILFPVQYCERCSFAFTSFMGKEKTCKECDTDERTI